MLSDEVDGVDGVHDLLGIDHPPPHRAGRHRLPVYRSQQSLGSSRQKPGRVWQGLVRVVRVRLAGRVGVRVPDRRPRRQVVVLVALERLPHFYAVAGSNHVLLGFVAGARVRFGVGARHEQQSWQDAEEDPPHPGGHAVRGWGPVNKQVCRWLV